MIKSQNSITTKQVRSRLVKNIYFFKQKKMDLKILEPIKKYLKEFNSVEEFNNFYSLNKDELDTLTTHKLNKMYHIKGYRITKIKNELMLKKWDEEKKTDEENDVKEEIKNIKEDIKKIKMTIDNIIEFCNKL